MRVFPDRMGRRSETARGDAAGPPPYPDTEGPNHGDFRTRRVRMGCLGPAPQWADRPGPTRPGGGRLPPPEPPGRADAPRGISGQSTDLEPIPGRANPPGEDPGARPRPVRAERRDRPGEHGPGLQG